MEIQQIEINKIYPNPKQPRKSFNEETLEALSDSIEEIGLINPIQVIQKGDKFQIVAGERRWKAHQLLKRKTISVIIKQYENDGGIAVESLIENIHRENLSLEEKGNFLKRIIKLDNVYYTKENITKFKPNVIGKINIKELAKKVAMSEIEVRKSLKFIELDKDIKECGLPDHNIIEITEQIEDKKIIKKVIKKALDEDWGRKKIRGFAKLIKKAQPEVKEALFEDDITIEQAERICKLKDEKSRRTAIAEHKNIKLVDTGVENNIVMKNKAQAKRQIDKRLLQAGNWIKSFRNTVTDSRKQIGETIKVLLVATKFITLMDEKQKERLNEEIERFTEILNKGNQLAEQIRQKI